MNAHIYPSLISADLLDLKKTIVNLDDQCAGFHIDIMDNHFVPNLTWGHKFANEIDAASNKPSWVHLMVTDPQSIIDKLTLKENSIVSFHFESTKDITELVNIIKTKKWIPSLTISPKTDVKEIFDFLPMLHHVLLMSVKPGFSGQTFLPQTINRLLELATFKKEHNLNFILGLDGGINETNIKECYELGATNFAVASGIFNNSNYIAATKKLYELVK